MHGRKSTLSSGFGNNNVNIEAFKNNDNAVNTNLSKDNLKLRLNDTNNQPTYINSSGYIQTVSQNPIYFPTMNEEIAQYIYKTDNKIDNNSNIINKNENLNNKTNSISFPQTHVFNQYPTQGTNILNNPTTRRDYTIMDMPAINFNSQILAPKVLLQNGKNITPRRSLTGSTGSLGVNMNSNINNGINLSDTGIISNQLKNNSSCNNSIPSINPVENSGIFNNTPFNSIHTHSNPPQNVISSLSTFPINTNLESSLTAQKSMILSDDKLYNQLSNTSIDSIFPNKYINPKFQTINAQSCIFNGNQSTNCNISTPFGHNMQQHTTWQLQYMNSIPLLAQIQIEAIHDIPNSNQTLSLYNSASHIFDYSIVASFNGYDDKNETFKIGPFSRVDLQNSKYSSCVIHDEINIPFSWDQPTLKLKVIEENEFKADVIGYVIINIDPTNIGILNQLQLIDPHTNYYKGTICFFIKIVPNKSNPNFRYDQLHGPNSILNKKKYQETSVLNVFKGFCCAE
ncbi:hypothetical protein ACR3K2_27720 [Cryptosporidium serpentis]